MTLPHCNTKPRITFYSLDIYLLYHHHHHHRHYSSSSSSLLTPGLLWPTYWPSTFHFQLHHSPKYPVLISTFYMTKPSQPHFPLFVSRFSTPHLLLTSSSLVILSCHLTLDMYHNILWSQLANNPSSLSVSAQVSAAYSSNVGLTHTVNLRFFLQWNAMVS